MNARSHLVYGSLACACLGINAAPSFAATPEEGGDPAEVFTDPEDWYDLDAPTSIDYELDEIYTPHAPMFRFPPIDEPTNWLLNRQDALAEDIGLRVGLAYTHVYQQATGGPGTRWGTAGDVDLLFDWTLVGRGTEDTGRLFFSVEERFRAGPIPPSDLRFELGTLVGTTGAFNDRGLVVRDLFWDQRFFDARLRVLAGRAAPDDYVGWHRLASSNNGFFNGNIAGNSTMAFVGHGPLALVSTHPTDTFYATLGGANAYSVSNESSIDTLFEEGAIYGFGEVGLTPRIEGLGNGRYALTGWSMPPRHRDGLPSDWGFSVTVEQYVADNLWFLGRFGYADRGITGVERSFSAAVAIDGLLGSPDNVTGLGFGYAIPTSGDLREEKTIELFHRFQVLEHTQFSIGAQAIFDPSNAPDDDVVGVFSVRLRLAL